MHGVSFSPGLVPRFPCPKCTAAPPIWSAFSRRPSRPDPASEAAKAEREADGDHGVAGGPAIAVTWAIAACDVTGAAALAGGRHGGSARRAGGGRPWHRCTRLVEGRMGAEHPRQLGGI